ncbi:hypothetical protein U1Q18_021575 [Sarracenia purpurea var. burkii]
MTEPEANRLYHSGSFSWPIDVDEYKESGERKTLASGQRRCAQGTPWSNMKLCAWAKKIALGRLAHWNGRKKKTNPHILQSTTVSIHQLFIGDEDKARRRGKEDEAVAALVVNTEREGEREIGR